jgi:hypothetical protein
MPRTAKQLGQHISCTTIENDYLPTPPVVGFLFFSSPSKRVGDVLMSLKKETSLLVLGLLGVVAIPSAFAQNQDNISEALKDFSRLDPEQKNMILQSMGAPNPSEFSVAKVMAWLIFGGIGFVAFFYGKKQQSFKPLVIGLILMVYPYFVSNTIGLYALGLGLCLLLYFWRD